LRLRRQIMEAMLICCGERGFRHVRVQDVIDRYGGYRVQFYRHFSSKADCYTAAYEAASEELCAALLGAGATAPSWREGLRATLRKLAAVARERPLWTRGVLVEVHVACGAAMTKRVEVIERLSRAIDSARHETESRHSPPPITAAFIVSAIEESVGTALANGAPERFAEAVPQLVYLAVAAYFGEESAREELAAPRS
jgi:AcrR family transcriptional regulator